MEMHNAEERVDLNSAEKALTFRLQRLLSIRQEIDNAAIVTISTIVSSMIQEGEHVRLYLPVDFPELAAFYESNKEFMNSFFDDTRRDFIQLFQGKTLDVWMIQDVALTFLKSLRRNNVGYLNVGSETYNWIDEEAIIHLANLATAMYLEAWLAHDQKNYQTPNGFSDHPYEKEDLYKRGMYSSASVGKRSAIRRAFERYKTFDELQKWQANMERNPPVFTSNTDDDYKKPVDLITLAWCEAFQEGGLEILKYLFERKNMMTRAEDTRREKEIGLADACQAYQQYISKIDKIKTDKNAPVANHRRFVASSMMLHKMERAYHFHMAGRIAERIYNSDKPIDPEKRSKNAAEAILGRFAGTVDYLFVPSWAAGEDFNTRLKKWKTKFHLQKRGKRPYVYANECLDVLSVDFYIDIMYCVGGEKASDIDRAIHLLRRVLTQDLIFFISSLYPPSEQHTWSENDFYNAALFYREHYPVTNELLKVAFPSLKERSDSKDVDFYSFFRNQYIELLMDQKGPLSRGRKRLKAQRKKAKQKSEAEKAAKTM